MQRGTDDAMRLVRSEMCRKLDVLETMLARRGPHGVRIESEALCALAAEYGMTSAQRLAEALAVALGNGGRGAAVQPWIERLRDAIDCRATDAQASDTWLASIMVRFAG